MEKLLIIILILLCTLAAFADTSVMVIDYGIDPTHPALKGANIKCANVTDCSPTHWHATSMLSIIYKGDLKHEDKLTCPVTIFICDYQGNNELYEKCLKRATELHPTYVNFSSVGTGLNTTEYWLIRQLVESGTTFITATGNEGLNIVKHPRFPAAYNMTNEIGLGNFLDPINIISVEAVDESGFLWDKSNRSNKSARELGVNVKAAAPGGKYVYTSGTSVATALYTHKQLQLRCKNGF